MGLESKAEHQADGHPATSKAGDGVSLPTVAAVGGQGRDGWKQEVAQGMLTSKSEEALAEPAVSWAVSERSLKQCVLRARVQQTPWSSGLCPNQK